MLIVFILLIVLFGFLLYKLKFFNRPYISSGYQNVVIWMITFLFIVFLAIKPSILYSKYVGGAEDLYSKYLVNSIINKKAEISLEPSEELKNLENPYNPEERENVEYYFDASYYNGKYYIYFGIVPAILVFVPYTLITGQYLPISSGTFIFVIIAIIASAILAIQIYKRWFKNLPFNLLILFIVSLWISGLYIWNTWRIWAYELTLISGFAFVLLGLICILLATKNKNNINMKYLVLSCLCMALSVGCRPTFLLSSFLLIPFLYDIIKTSYKNKKLKYAIPAIVIPYIIVAIPLMFYNYIRYDSIFEFGAKYQLTAVDVTNLSDRYKDIPKGLYEYLLEPPKFKTEYPYIELRVNPSGHTYNYYNGVMVCGILFLNLSLISCIFMPKYIRKVKDITLRNLMISLPIVGLISCILVVYMGGNAQRYAVDFFWMFSIISMILWFLMYQYSTKEVNKKAIIIILIVLFIISICINFCGTFLNSESDYLKLYFPKIYEFFRF